MVSFVVFWFSTFYKLQSKLLSWSVSFTCQARPSWCHCNRRVHGHANPQDFKCYEAVHRTNVLLLYVYLLCTSRLQRHVKNVSKQMSHKCAGSSHWNALPDSLALSLQTEQTLWLRWPPWMLGSLTSRLWLFYCKKFPFYCKGGKKKSHEQKHAFLLSDGLWGPDIQHREVFAPPGVTW